MCLYIVLTSLTPHQPALKPYPAAPCHVRVFVYFHQRRTKPLQLASLWWAAPLPPRLLPPALVQPALLPPVAASLLLLGSCLACWTLEATGVLLPAGAVWLQLALEPRRWRRGGLNAWRLCRGPPALCQACEATEWQHVSDVVGLSDWAEVCSPVLLLHMCTRVLQNYGNLWQPGTRPQVPTVVHKSIDYDCKNQVVCNLQHPRRSVALL